ncbi:MAG: MAM protein [Candidatus Berkelbacteria bacterium Athens1014_28]|uniref:MAM protein n=1 Tax=Candidatus Berkelbacteria bacterium Athens1014_28 TaxID=2017145 RepID=A0A554LNF6_9BACT|nr:MAG: MAM protein [Candidatus Berkelbacteria bacterium Athens1014_28]
MGAGSLTARLYEAQGFEAGGVATHTSAVTQIDGTSTLQSWDSFKATETDRDQGGGNAATKIEYQFRSGDGASAWDAWTAKQEYSGSDLDLSALSADSSHRYMQVLTTLTTTDAAQTPTLHDYTIYYTRDDTCDNFDKVTISPTSTSLATGGQATFSAASLAVGGAPMPNPTFSWSASGGAITGSGFSVTYTAPALPGTYTVSVTSNCGGNAIATITVTTPTPTSTCSDGVQNGSETGVDCGGSCPACPTTPPLICPPGYQPGDAGVCDVSLMDLIVLNPEGGEIYSLTQNILIKYKFYPGFLVSYINQIVSKKTNYIYADAYLSLDGITFTKILDDIDISQNARLVNGNTWVESQTSWQIPDYIGYFSKHSKILVRVHYLKSSSPQSFTPGQESSGTTFYAYDTSKEFEITGLVSPPPPPCIGDDCECVGNKCRCIGQECDCTDPDYCESCVGDDCQPCEGESCLPPKPKPDCVGPLCVGGTIEPLCIGDLCFPNLPANLAIIIPLLIALLLALVNPENWALVSNFIRNLFYLFAKGKEKKHKVGIVYNASSGLVVPDILISLFRKRDNRLIKTVKSDLRGRIGLETPPGEEYILEINTAGIIILHKNFLVSSALAYDQNYFAGEIFRPSESEMLFDKAIPVVGNIQSAGKLFAIEKFSKFLRVINLPVLIFGLIISAVVLYQVKSTYNYTIFSLYTFCLFWIFIKMLITDGRSFGFVYDRESGKAVDLAIVRVLSETSGKLVKTIVSDEHGKFSLALPKGYYKILVEKTGYILSENITLRVKSAFKPAKVRISLSTLPTSLFELRGAGKRGLQQDGEQASALPNGEQALACFQKQPKGWTPRSIGEQASTIPNNGEQALACLTEKNTRTFSDSTEIIENYFDKREKVGHDNFSDQGISQLINNNTISDTYEVGVGSESENVKQKNKKIPPNWEIPNKHIEL